MANPSKPGTTGTAEQAGPRTILAMAGVHLAVVGFLVADFVFTWALAELSRVQVVLLVAAVLWLAAGAFISVKIGQGFRLPLGFENVLVSLTAAAVAVGVLEVGLRLVVPDPSRYLRPPNVRSSTSLDGEQAPGVRGVANFTTNEWGLRGPSVELMSGKPNASRIITIGGSTTLCEFLDDSEEWSHLLMQDLNHRQDKTFAFVASAAANGHNTADHLEMLKRFTLMENADVLVFLTGVNDLTATLAFEGGSTQEALTARAFDTSFTDPPRYPFYTRSRVYALMNAFRSLAGFRRNPRGSEWYAERRRMRAEAPTVPMPDLTLGVQEYQTRVRNLAEECRSAGKRCVFLTQPTMWRSDQLPAEERLLFFGSTGPSENPKGFVRASDLARGMNQFNEALLTECRINSLECYDLAAAIPKNTTAFYDDCHFNEEGARLVAKFLADRMLEAAPLRD